MSTVDQFLGKPQTIITDYHFDVTQKSILNDLRKAEDDFKQTMIENSPSEIFNQASHILYVSDALFELTGFIEDFSSGDYPEHTYSYEKQISALFDRYYTNTPHNGTELFIAAAERAWYDSSVNYEVGSDDKAYFMEDYVSDYFGLLPYLKAYEPKPVEITNDAPQHSQSKSQSI